MNDSLAQDISIYQLALAMQTPPQPLPLSPATLLSLLRSQIDLLIEQKIAATLWVKLPPGKIWHSELLRYQSAVGVSVVIYDCQIDERRLMIVKLMRGDKEKGERVKISAHHPIA